MHGFNEELRRECLASLTGAATTTTRIYGEDSVVMSNDNQRGNTETTSTTIARTITISTTTIIQMVREPTRKYANTTAAATHADITTIATITGSLFLRTYEH